MTETPTVAAQPPRDDEPQEPAHLRNDVPNASAPGHAPTQSHPYEKLDRASRAALARATGGVSPHSFMATWMDWAMHLNRSPGRQMELAERAMTNAAKLGRHALALAAGTDPLPPFQPRAQDHRFEAPDWSKAPFAYWQQAFLATQDWWQAATATMPGVGQRDAARAQFQGAPGARSFRPRGSGSARISPARRARSCSATTSSN
jgi:polyhydroxyalkanoate synthase